MPSYQLSDLTRMRIEELSFFLMVLLLSALGVKVLWNMLARDFPRLPRLGFGRALALTTLLGLFTVLVLSMISGARELLTPGAWRRQGSTYRITDPANEPTRRKGLEKLRVVLWDYAKKHNGAFPKQDFIPEADDAVWLAPDKDGTRYFYNGGQTTETPKAMLATEPLVFAEPHLVLWTTGEISHETSSKVDPLQKGRRE